MYQLVQIFDQQKQNQLVHRYHLQMSRFLLFDHIMNQFCSILTLIYFSKKINEKEEQQKQPISINNEEYMEHNMIG